MAKVIKDRANGTSKGYGFVKYRDVQMANNAIMSMNGYRLEGRAVAVRVAGKPPPPAIPPGPPASTMPTHPTSIQPVGAYPSQQFMPGGPLPNTTPSSYGGPPASYTGNPIPWGPPVPPPPYAQYAPPPPPPPGSNMYAPVPGQPMAPYSTQYPPPPGQPVSSSAPTQPTSSEAQNSYIPGALLENSTSAPPASSNIYGSSAVPMPPAYMTVPLGYSSYYTAVPPPPPPPPPPVGLNEPSPGMSNVPWVQNSPMPPPASSVAEKTSYAADSEYDKFMAEMK